MRRGRGSFRSGNLKVVELSPWCFNVVVIVVAFEEVRRDIEGGSSSAGVGGIDAEASVCLRRRHTRGRPS